MRVKLGEVFESQIAGEWGNECAENENGTKVLRTTNFTQEGRINYDDVVIRSINQSKVEKKRLHYGDIILEKSGGTEKTPVGRVVFCDEAIEDSVYLCNNFTQAMRVNQSIASPKYVFYYMWNFHCSGKTELLQNKTTGIRNLQVRLYLDLSIPLPPLETQRHIAAVLDKVSALIALRRQQLDKLDELVKARFVEMFGDPMMNPHNLPKVILGSVLTIEPQNGLYKPQSDYVSDGTGVPILRIDSFYDGRVSNFSSLKRLICSEIELKRYSLYENDIVINRVNSIEYLGKCGLIRGLVENTVFESNMMRLHVDEHKFHPVYITKLLCSQFIYQQILKRAKKAVNQASINQKDVQSFIVYMPSMERQEQFAAIVDQTEKTKAAVQQALEKLETMKKALMQEYFGGEV